mmetsp:Transcript_9379/g.12940  ORF Transcript_9379/g.12940 Transcript_9379/m.12940 type:complete len:507 (+) Transcript_9379:169-1689(+)
MDTTMASKVSICNLINTETTTIKQPIFEFKTELFTGIKTWDGISYFNALLARTSEQAQWVDDNATADQKTALWNQFLHVFNGYLEYSATLFGKKITLEQLSQSLQTALPSKADDEEDIGRTFKNANFQFSKFLKELNLQNSKRIYAIEALYASIFLSGCRNQLPTDSSKDLPPERKSDYRKEQYQQAIDAESPTALLIAELVRWVNDLDMLPEQSKKMIWKECSSIWCFGNFDRKSFRRTIKKWRSGLLDNMHNIFILSDVLCHHSLTDFASAKINSWTRILRAHSKKPTDLPEVPVSPQPSLEASSPAPEKEEALRLPPIDQLMLSIEQQESSKQQPTTRAKSWSFSHSLASLTSVLRTSEAKVDLPSLTPPSVEAQKPTSKSLVPSSIAPVPVTTTEVVAPTPNTIQINPTTIDITENSTIKSSPSITNLNAACQGSKTGSKPAPANENLTLMSSIIQSPQTLSMIFNSERIRHRQKRSFWKTIQPPPAPQPVLQNTKMARKTV